VCVRAGVYVRVYVRVYSNLFRRAGSIKPLGTHKGQTMCPLTWQRRPYVPTKVGTVPSGHSVAETHAPLEGTRYLRGAHARTHARTHTYIVVIKHEISIQAKSQISGTA